MGIISLLLTVVIFGPFFWAATMGKSGTRAMKRQFRQTVKELDLNLAPSEQWSNFLIGIDSQKNVLLHISATGQGQTVQRIDLPGLQDCRVVAQERTYRTKNQREEQLERLELELRFGHKKEPVRLLFYQKSDAYGEHLERQRAERWKDRILSIAAPRTPIRAAA